MGDEESSAASVMPSLAADPGRGDQDQEEEEEEEERTTVSARIAACHHHCGGETSVQTV